MHGPGPLLVLSKYFDYSWLLKAPGGGEESSNPIVIKQRTRGHVRRGGQCENLLEICRIVRRSLILARVLSLIYPVIRSSSRLIASLSCKYII